jgi:outer membrane protein OmpA-like peptidoglycan-associated protein
MILIHRSGMAAVLMALSAMAVGCCDKEKKEIEYLTQQNLDLTNKNKDMRSQLAEARTRESQLMSQTDSRDLEVTSLRTENQDLKQKLAAGGTHTAAAGTPAAGGETTVYTETVGSDVLFDPGKAELHAAGKARLDQTASTVRSKYGGMTVRVYGYTDSDPIRRTRNLWADNLDLSANRAMAVTRYLIGKGIHAESVETVAMGATHSIAPNTTKDGKAKNRRVVIMVVKK